MASTDEAPEDTVETLSLEIAYLRGALQEREMELQAVMADKMMLHAQVESMTRTLADLVIKVSQLTASIVQLVADIEVDTQKDFRSRLLS